MEFEVKSVVSSLLIYGKNVTAEDTGQIMIVFMYQNNVFIHD